MDIRIAIVEDEPKNAKLLQQFIMKYQKETNQIYHTILFEDGEAFVSQLDKKWDLILLDIEMPKLNGIEIAKRIREVDSESKIVFVTNIAEYAVDGYLYHASNYILKPLNYHEFYMKIGKLLRQFERQQEDSLAVSNRGEWLKLSLSKIYYIEAQGHRIIIHTADGNVESTSFGTLSEYEETLKGKGFYRCYKCYLVNLRNVYDIKETCELKDGTKLEIGRGKKKEFRRILMNFFMGETNGTS